MVNFSAKHEAAPINFRQLHKLFPSREIKSGPVNSLKLADKSMEFDALNFSHKGKKQALKDYLNDVRATSLLVIKDGNISHEQYFYGADQDSKFIVFSTTKSIVSLLVGIAVDEGLIKSVDDRLTDYLPELSQSGYVDATIKQVLQMTSALYFPGIDMTKGGAGRDMKKVSMESMSYGSGGLREHLRSVQANKDIAHGERWEYVNSNTQALAALVEKVSGMSVSDYMEAKLWKKIGAQASAHWLVDRYRDDQAMEHGWMGFIATVRDLGRLGLLVLHNGVVNGEQVVSEAWLKASVNTDNQAVQKIAADGFFSYGYQWWIPEGDKGEFMSIGYAGQLIYVNPSKKTVIVQTTANDDYSREDNVRAVKAFRVLSNQ